MASVCKSHNGRRVVQFVGADGKRRSIRLGVCSDSTARLVAAHVERLAAFQSRGLPIDADSVVWLASIGDKLRARLASVGLAPPVATRPRQSESAKAIDRPREPRRRRAAPQAPPVPKVATMLTADQLAERFNGRLSAARIMELVAAGLAPHYEFEGQILFRFDEMRRWVGENLLCQRAGRPIPAVVHVTPIMIGEASPVAPVELRQVATYLLPLPVRSLAHAAFSGIYFLCRDGKVVYVGQATNVAVRIGAHGASKQYDSAFCMRVPMSDLDFVEAAFIQALAPEYNHGQNGRLICPVGAMGTECGLEVVRQFAEGATCLRQQSD